MKVGDVVLLKSSHAPRMTIADIRDERARCQWFSGAESKSDHFPVASLRLVTDEDDMPMPMG
jgi:uncharacterized protein YodC (DUF2158 family)